MHATRSIIRYFRPINAVLLNAAVKRFKRSATSLRLNELFLHRIAWTTPRLGRGGILIGDRSIFMGIDELDFGSSPDSDAKGYILDCNVELASSILRRVIFSIIV